MLPGLPATADENPERPIILEASYAADIWSNSGGLEDGTRYLDNLSLAATADLEKLWSWNGAEARASLLYNNGESLSELTGDSMIVSNIEAGVEAVRLYEAWVNFPVSERANLRIGKYDLNSEFDVLDSSGLFLGSAHGIGMDIAQTGEQGPSIFPITGFAARLEYEISEVVTLRVAALDGVPGDPGDPQATQIKLSDEEGALLIGEFAIERDDHRILAGVWSYTEEFGTHDGSDEASNHGIYVRGETRIAEMSNGELSGFVRGGIASGEVNQFSTFASAGVTYERDELGAFGAAIAYAGTSDRWRASNPNGGDNETVFELTYARSLTEWLDVQPNLQFVANPAADSGVDDALAIGIRFTVTPPLH